MVLKKIYHSFPNLIGNRVTFTEYTEQPETPGKNKTKQKNNKRTIKMPSVDSSPETRVQKTFPRTLATVQTRIGSREGFPATAPTGKSNSLREEEEFLTNGGRYCRCRFPYSLLSSMLFSWFLRRGNY